MTIPIKILIADDHPIVRDGFQKLLELTDGFEVIGTAENGKQAVRLVLLHHPDVILLDVYMPEMNGLETIQEIRALHSEARILLITSHPDDELVIQALLNGANGFLLKEWKTERIVSAIQNSLKRANGLAGCYVAIPDNPTEESSRETWEFCCQCRAARYPNT